MTHEEAISRIEGILDLYPYDPPFSVETCKVLEMAINALKAQLSQEGTTKDTTSSTACTTTDTISRHDDEFWRKRAEKYSEICLAMTAEMAKGIKFDSIRIDENGITFGKERPERKVGEWVQVPRFEGDTQPDLECPFCKNKVGWWDMTKYCDECGADMRGKS